MLAKMLSFCLILLCLTSYALAAYEPVPAVTEAASVGDIERLKYLIETKKPDLDSFDWLGQTALHMAAKFAQIEAARLLLQHGANCCIPNVDFEETPLHLAAKGGCHEIVRMLTDAGADVNAVISAGVVPGGTPLVYAAFYDPNSFETSGFLVKKGANLKATNSYGQTPLHLYVEQLNLRAVTSLIGDYKINPNLLNSFKCPPLNVLSMQQPGNANLIPIGVYLLENGADPNGRCLNEGGSGRTPLHRAVSTRNLGLGKVLIDFGANVNSFDRKGMTPLYSHLLLSEHIDFDLTRMLMRSGASLEIRTASQSSKCNSLLAAFLRRALPADQTICSVVRLLVESGIKLNAECLEESLLLAQYLENFRIMEPDAKNVARKRTARHLKASEDEFWAKLLRAASFGDVYSIAAIFNIVGNNSARISALVNEPDNVGKTSLHWTCSGEYPEATELLLNYGALINITDQIGRTPLDYAAATGNSKLVEMLLNHRAKPSDSTLAIAVEESNSPKVVELLLNAGAGIDQTREPSLLHVATEKQNIRMIKLLMEHGADPNARLRQSGVPPLGHLIESNCCYPQLPVLSMLLKFDADVNARDDAGRTPLLIALAVRRRKEVIRFLLQNGANPNIPDRQGCNAPIFMAIKMASTNPNRFHLHSIPDYGDDEEVGDIVADLLTFGAWPHLKDPCMGLTALQLAYRKRLPKTTYILRENMV